MNDNPLAEMRALKNKQIAALEDRIAELESDDHEWYLQAKEIERLTKCYAAAKVTIDRFRKQLGENEERIAKLEAEQKKDREIMASAYLACGKAETKVAKLEADRQSARREREEMREDMDASQRSVSDMANSMIYHGNSVDYWYCKAMAYKKYAGQHYDTGVLSARIAKLEAALQKANDWRNRNELRANELEDKVAREALKENENVVD